MESEEFDCFELVSLPIYNSTNLPICIFKEKEDENFYVFIDTNPICIPMNQEEKDKHLVPAMYKNIESIYVFPVFQKPKYVHVKILFSQQSQIHEYYVNYKSGQICSHFPYKKMNESKATQLFWNSISCSGYELKNININYVVYNKWGIVVFGIDKIKKRYFAFFIITQGKKTKIVTNVKIKCNKNGNIHVISDDPILAYSFFNSKNGNCQREVWNSNDPSEIKPPKHMINGYIAYPINHISHF